MKYRLKRFSTSILNDLIDDYKRRRSYKMSGIEDKEDISKDDNKNYFDKLLENNKKDNIFLADDKVTGNNSPLQRGPNDYKTEVDVINVDPKDKDAFGDHSIRTLKDTEIKDKNIIHLGEKSSYTAAAHEIGHTKFQKTAVGGTLHRLQAKTKSPMSSGDIGATVGLITGARSEKLKRQGKKEGFLSKNAHWMIPVAANTPKLIEEGMASRYGIKELKKVGVDGDKLSDSKRYLANAFGTYALPVGKEVLKGVAGRAVGKSVGKSYYKVKDKISKKKSKDQNSKE